MSEPMITIDLLETDGYGPLIFQNTAIRQKCLQTSVCMGNINLRVVLRKIGHLVGNKAHHAVRIVLLQPLATGLAESAIQIEKNL